MVSPNTADHLTSLGRSYLSALIAGDRDRACAVVLSAVEQDGLRIEDVYHHVLAAAQRELGRLWEEGKLSVAEEHLATATTQLVMSRLYARVPRRPEPKGVLVATCVEGDLHELGLRMVTDLFELSGWETHYLGANTPVAGLLELLALRNADALAVSAVMPEYLPSVRALVGSVKERRELAGVRVLVGGRAFDKDPEMAEWVGADFYATSADAAMAWLGDARDEPVDPHVRALEFEPPPRPRLPHHDDLTRLKSELTTLQRRLAQESAALAEQARRSRLYLGTAVHDLRGSIGAIRGVSRQLAAALAAHLTPEQVEAFEVIDSAAAYMLSVVDEGSSAAQEEAPSVSLDRVRTELGPIVRACLQRAYFEAEDAGVTLRVDAPEGPVTAAIDVRRFEQIVDNLVANAIRFAPKGTAVVVHLERRRGEVVVRVDDEGPAVPEEDRSRIFRTHDLVPSGERGTGYGLAIVRHLAVAHGGAVRVESSARGGAAFIVELPA